MNSAEQIKQTTTMLDVLDRYGFTPNAKGNINCPFHQEKTASLKVYENSFYCFGCGVGGDIFDFAMKIESCDFAQAVKKLGGETLSFTQKRALINQKYKQDKVKKQREQNKKEYHELLDEWIRLDINFRDNKPKTMDEEPHPIFVEALQKLAYQGYLLDCFTKEW